MLVQVQGLVAGAFTGSDGREVSYRHVHYTAPLAAARDGFTSKGFSAAVEKNVSDEIWQQLIKVDRFPVTVDVQIEQEMTGLNKMRNTWKRISSGKAAA